jgi:hypothetical protein
MVRWMRARRMVSRFARPLLVTTLLMAAVAGCTSSSTQSSSSTSKETFCALLVAFRASNDSLDTDVASGDPTATQTAVKRLVSQVKALQKRAPDDIEPYVATVSTFIGELDALFATYGYDLGKLSADPAGTEKYATINDEAATTALDQLRAYGDVDCGDKTPPTVTTTASAASVLDTSTTVAPPVADSTTIP